jgi:protein-disulfide isomerase
MKTALIFFSLFAAGQSLEAQPCQPLTLAERSQFERFVEKWYHVPAGQHVMLTDSATVDSACYRKLVFRASAPVPPLVLYLTSDKTHLVSGVMDLAVDPAVVQQKAREELNARLVSGALLTSGSSSAPMKLVVFSDFECPYCKQFADVVASLRPAERAQLQIVYHQFPLNTHPWASDAAQISTCAALQDTSTFWKLHNFFFDNQEELSKDTLQSKALDFLSHQTSVEAKAISACLSEKSFEPHLHQDEQLAMDLGITGTPSIFLNGRKISVRSVDDLRNALRTAEQDAATAGQLAPQAASDGADHLSESGGSRM